MITFELRDGYDAMDFEKVTGMLREVWWSPGIKISEVIKGAQNSALLTGAFTGDHQQIGYARVISDKTRFAYIMDVVVDERYRKQGIGRAMIRHILKHSELSDVYQWLLLTKDAHGVYTQVGFVHLETPENWLEIRKRRPER